MRQHAYNAVTMKEDEDTVCLDVVGLNMYRSSPDFGELWSALAQVGRVAGVFVCVPCHVMSSCFPSKFVRRL